MSDDHTDNDQDEKVQEDKGQGPNNKGQEGMEELKAKIVEAQQKDVEETESLNELEEAQKAQQDAEDRSLRAMAELKNAQQRMEVEKNQFAAFATQGLVLKVLEIYENYHRLMEHRPERAKEEGPRAKAEEEWLKGLELIDQQFGSFLEQQGVSAIVVKPGDMIDPEKHEAMMTGEGQDGEILEVFSQGYEMKGRVIKTAKVKVAKA
jgi:molecular chaperone GrpE